MALTTGLVSFASVVVVACLWSVPTAWGLRQTLGELARRLAPRWIALAALSVAMVAMFPTAFDGYGDAQLATDADELKAIVDGDVWRNRWAALFDVGFAAVNALLALSLAPMVRGWDRRQRFVPLLRRSGSIACGVLVVAALFDEAENVAVLTALGRYDHLGDGTVEAMTFLGSVKWTLSLVGLVAFLATAVAKFLTAPPTQSWIRRSGLAYAVYLGLVVGFVGAAAFHQRWMFWFLMPALAVCGSWLNEKVSESRKPDADNPEAEAARRCAGWVRVRLAVLQLGLGAVLVVSGLRWSGLVGDAAVVGGIALVILSLGAFVSEVRQVVEHAAVVTSVMLAVALASLIVAYVASGNLTWAAFGVAVVLGELATEVSAEAYQQRRAGAPFAGRVLCRGIGAVVLVSGLALVGLVLIDVDRLHALGVVALLAAVVWMASIDGDSLVLVVLLALVLVASTRPGDQEVDESLVAVPGAPYVLVLGDSYTSGEGATHYLPGTNEVIHDRDEDDPHTNDCRQAPSAWAFQLVDRVVREGGLSDGDTSFPTRVLFLACSGAVTENLRRPGAPTEGHRQLALYEQREQELGAPALVIVGIGGNDAGFGDIGQACVGPGNCATLARQLLVDRLDRTDHEKRRSESLADISDDLNRTYRVIRRAVGQGVPIVATAYPSPIATGGRCADALLDHAERTFISRFVGQLNETVRRAAEKRDVSYMDLSGALERHGAQLCAAGPGGAGINFLAFGSKGGTIRDSLDPRNWSHNSLHPNRRGHTALMNEAYEWFSAHWPLTEPTRDPADPTLPSAEEVIEGLDVEQCTTQPDCEIDGYTWLNGRARDLFRDSIVVVALAMTALRFAFLPLVDAGRRANLSLFRIVRSLWQRI